MMRQTQRSSAFRLLFAAAALLCLWFAPGARGQELPDDSTRRAPTVEELERRAPDKPALRRGLDDRSIHVATWAPLTGPAAPWGAVARGMRVYFKMLNMQGGIHGRNIKLFIVDDKYDPTRTLPGLQRVAERKGVFACVGGVGAESGRSVVEYLAARGIPWVAPAAGSSVFTKPPRRGVFGVAPTYRAQSSTLVKYAVEVLKAENLGLLYSEDSAGLEALAGAEAQMAEYNSKLAAALAVKSGDRDLDARLDALSQAGCQVVLMFVQPVHAVLARERSAEMEYRPIWMTGTDLSDMAAMHKLSDRNWAGTISALAVELPSAEGPLIDEYREAYREYAAQGERWGEFFLLGFGLAEPFVEALRRAGRDLDRESLILQLEAMTGFRGIMGRIGFSPQRRQGSNWMHICQSLEGGAGRRLTGWFEPHWLDND